LELQHGKEKDFVSIRSALFGATGFVFCCDNGEPSGIAATPAMATYTSAVGPRQPPVEHLSLAGLS